MGTIDLSVKRMFDQIMPEMPLSDVAAGVAHYRDVLGAAAILRLSACVADSVSISHPAVRLSGPDQ